MLRVVSLGLIGRASRGRRGLLALVVIAVLALLVGADARAQEVAPAAEPERGATGAPPPDPCDVMWTLTLLDEDQRALMHDACELGPKPSGELAAAMARLASSPGWHAGALAHLVQPGGKTRFTAGAEQPAIEDIQTWVQLNGKAFAALPEGASGARRSAGLRARPAVHPDDPSGSWGPLSDACGEIRHGELMRSFLDSVEADAAPEDLPFDADFLECVGVDSARLRGTRVLTVRADGLTSLTAIIGTRTYTHVRVFDRASALKIGKHRFHVLVVPEAAPVTLVGRHQNLELPLYWHAIVGRNEAVWVEPVHMSCLELSYVADDDTRLYFDGVPIQARGVKTRLPGATRRERTLTISLDQARARLPDHEVVALKHVWGTADAPGTWTIRHRESLPAAVKPAELTRAHECRVLSLDFSEPAKKRIAVLGVSQGESCQHSPMWADDLRERVRRVIEDDPAHRERRQYANFSAYAAAADALSALKSRLNPQEGRTTGAETGADAMALVGTAAKEAWRQGIDTLLSFELQCSPREPARSRPSAPPLPGRDTSEWSYSLKATRIDVRSLFARGYHGRESLDLERFIHVESIGFESSRIQEPVLTVLLDRVFAVVGVRFISAASSVPYRASLMVRAGVYFDETEGAHSWGIPLAVVSLGPTAGVTWSQKLVVEDDGGRRAIRTQRPQICEQLASRGGLDAATRAELDRLLGAKSSGVVVGLRESSRAIDQSTNPAAAVYEGVFRAPRPGWYLLALSKEEAICVHATADPRELWGDIAITGGPLMFGLNKTFETGTAAKLYLRSRFGATWYNARARWIGYGLFGGFAFTDYRGARSDWSDLGGTAGGTGSASDEQRLWRRFSLLLGPMLEFRSRATAAEIEFRARVSPAVNLGVVDLTRIPAEAADFRRRNVNDGVLDVDFDVFVDLGMSAPVGRVELGGAIMLGYTGIDDRLALSSTTAFADANLFVGVGLFLGGAR